MDAKQLYINFDEYIRQGEPVSFFRNLLLGEQWNLRNCFMHINLPAEWRIQSNLAAPEQVPEQVLEQGLLHTNNPLIKKLVLWHETTAKKTDTNIY